MKGPAGWFLAYVVAFLFLVGAGAALVFASLGYLESTRLLWASAALSGVAIGATAASLILWRR